MMSKRKQEVIDSNKRAIADIVQSHWKYPMAMDVLIEESYTANSSDPNNFNYVVFIDEEGDIDWEYDGHGTRETISATTTKLMARAMALECLPCVGLSKKDKMTFKKMVGQAIVLAFKEKVKDSECVLSEAREYYNSRIVETSKIWSTLTLLISTTILCTILLLIGGFSINSLSKLYQPMVFGLFGSMVANFRRIIVFRNDSNAGLATHILNILGHLSCGIVLGLLGVIFFKSGFCPEAMKGMCDVKEGAIVIAFASGLFESFIPSMLSKFVARSEAVEES